MAKRALSTLPNNVARRRKYAQDAEYRERIKASSKKGYHGHRNARVKQKRQYRKDNPEKVHEADRRAYEKRRGTKAYKDYQGDYQRKWQGENQEKINQQRRDRYWADPEKAREKARLKAAKNPEKSREYTRKSRAKRREIALQILAEFHGYPIPICEGCGSLEALTINHVGGLRGKEREPTSTIERKIRDGLLPLEGFNILCEICNWADSIERKNPHGGTYQITYIPPKPKPPLKEALREWKPEW